MDREAARAIEWDCQQTILRFTAAFDAGNFSEMAEYFAPDGIWVRAEGPCHGHAGLQELGRKRSAQILVRHVLSNIRVDVLDATHARATTYVTVYRHDFADAVKLPAPLHLELFGEYADDLELIGGRWLIARRAATAVFKRAPLQREMNVK